LSDDRGVLAVPLAIVKTENLDEEILKILENPLFKKVVIGESVNAKGEHNKVWEQTLKMVDRLKGKTEIEFVFEKEFFTSKHARVVDEEGAVDDRAAALTLQRYLDKQNQKAKKQKWHNISEDERRRAQEEIDEAEENMC
jgi:RNase H-fold protein (predicted Holliday junction resolvase)